MSKSYPSDAKRAPTARTTKVSRDSAGGKKAIRISQRSPKERELAAQLLEKIKDIPDVRHELCEKVRQQIADGAYDTADRLEIAAERLVEELLTDAGLVAPEGHDATD